MSSFLLVMYYNSFRSLRSSLLTIIINRVGDMGMIVRFYFLFSMGYMGWHMPWLGGVFLSFFLLVSGFRRRAQYPFMSWLPAAMAAPTPISSLVHSSTLVTAGVYLIIRFHLIFYSLSVYFFVSFLSVITMLFSGFIARREMDMKRVIAMSTLRQLGMMVFFVRFGRQSLCYFHLITHALFRAMLFMRCGFLLVRNFGVQDYRQLGEVGYGGGGFYLVFIFSNLRLIGVPFMSGFFSRDALIVSSFSLGSNVFLGLMFVFGCFFTVLYRLRIMREGRMGFRVGRAFSVQVSCLSLWVFMFLMFVVMV